MTVNFQKALKIAQSLGDVEEATSYGTPAIKLRGKLVARLREDGDSLVVGSTFEERAEMMATDPETYYITDHYLNVPWVLVRLSKVHPDALRDLLGRSLKLAQQARGAKPSKRGGR
ncbi:MAG TPA: MmcQ/YjbR family DNA-binding protein [Bryobacteraceae bacterium]|nr:MmcQ/YjbR family DNA-binding protein [Bryobacteraceae bacterium]